MAAAGNALRLCLRTCRQPAAPLLSTMGTTSRQPLAVSRRTLSTTQAMQLTREEIDNPMKQRIWEHIEDTFKDLSPEELKQLEQIVSKDEETGETMTFNEALAKDEADRELHNVHDRREFTQFVRKMYPRLQREDRSYDPLDPEAATRDPEETFNEDDITELAHSKLDELREGRHYARIAAWEMPLLSKLAKPFEPPTAQQPLRFRYTTYMGEYHPAEKKVVVEFAPKDLGLTEVQTDKLRKLVGTRYNPTKDSIKMSCESFGQPAQNKRYLSDLVDKLIAEAKDPKDTFEDVPLDTRHHTFKTKPKFPKEWYLTKERKLELAAQRARAAELDAAKAAEGRLVDGVKSIETYLAPPIKPAKAGKEVLGADALAEMVVANRARPGKGAVKQARK
ncbi:37S ribosomal protein S24 [Plectosphaerella cucumerina]|uniref:37S ribosomal protein S24 n=1 Tax=Plectosphaerella cucumerina TaxID=40658 RepID=A0A8K0X8R9_9PEZI|nr:37S ribosomal protein S24 [Plectosphaerella cucumerina]